MLWRLRQTRTRDDVLTLGYFTSKRALLQYCKTQIGGDFPSLCDCPCNVATIGKRKDTDGACSVDHAGTITFVGEWIDGNNHRITRAVPCFVD
jgi:hypothetical protein